MSHSELIKQKAIELRESGLSIGQIAVPLRLAESTVSVWVKHVPLSMMMRERLQQNSSDGRAKGRWIVGEKRKKEYDRIRLQAQKIVDKDFTHLTISQWQMIAALLFWCEGTKRPSLSQGVQFMNADPMLIRTFLFALRHGFDVDEKKLRIVLYLHEYHKEPEQKAFWSERTSIRQEQFRRIYWKPNTSKRKHPDDPGCVSVRYPSAKLARMLVALYHALAQKIGA